MNPEQPTRSKNYDAVAAQLRDETPEAVVELIARQMDRADDAKARIETEGSVVRDMKGSVIPHPAIQIELAATKLVADLIAKNKKPRLTF